MELRRGLLERDHKLGQEIDWPKYSLMISREVIMNVNVIHVELAKHMYWSLSVWKGCDMYMIKSCFALKECHLNICQPLLDKTYYTMYMYVFCRFRAVCWKNARFSIIPSGSYKQVSKHGMVKLQRYKLKCWIHLSKCSMKISVRMEEGIEGMKYDGKNKIKNTFLKSSTFNLFFKTYFFLLISEWEREGER